MQISNRVCDLPPLYASQYKKVSFIVHDLRDQEKQSSMHREIHPNVTQTVTGSLRL